MKIAYNILLPLIHILCTLLLAVLGFARMMAWSCWSLANTAVYFLIAAAVFSGQFLLSSWGQKRGWHESAILRLNAGVDYGIFSLQLVLAGAWLTWEFASPLLKQPLESPWLQLGALLPVMVVDVAAILLRKHSRDAQSGSGK